MTDILTIGQVAGRANVSAATIRYYERIGLLPAAGRTPSGYRVYCSTIVRRLLVIRSAQAFGFSLREIAGFLRVRDRGGKPCESVRGAAQQIVAAIDRQIAELVDKRQHMVGVLATWDRRLGKTQPEQRAYLLEMLGDGTPTPPGSDVSRHRAAPGRSPRHRLHHRADR